MIRVWVHTLATLVRAAFRATVRGLSIQPAGISPAAPPDQSSPAAGSARRSGRTATSTEPDAPRPGRRKSRASEIRFDRADGAAPDSSFPVGESVTDYLTGASMRTSSSTVQCANCQAFYSRESHALLCTENRGRCASCRSTRLQARGRALHPAHHQVEGSPAASATRQRAERDRTTRRRGSATHVAAIVDHLPDEGLVVTVTGLTGSSRAGSSAATVIVNGVVHSHGTWELIDDSDAGGIQGGVSISSAGSTMSVSGLAVSIESDGHRLVVDSRGTFMTVRR